MSVDPAARPSPFVFGAYASQVPAGHAADPTPPVPPAPEAVRPLDELIDRSLQRKLDGLCATVVSAVPLASGAGVVIADVAPRPSALGLAVRPATHAGIVASSPTAHAVLRTEWLLQEGPVRTSITSEQAVVSGRLGTDRRWPRLGHAFVAHDTSSAVSVPLPLGDEVAGGALAVYSSDEDAFDPRDVGLLTALGQAMADIIARDRLWHGAQWILRQSSQSRIVHQAVGIMISKHGDEEQALARLARLSTATARPLTKVAQMIVDEALAEAHLQFIAQTPTQRITHVAVRR